MSAAALWCQAPGGIAIAGGQLALAWWWWCGVVECGQRPALSRDLGRLVNFGRVVVVWQLSVAGPRPTAFSVADLLSSPRSPQRHSGAGLCQASPELRKCNSVFLMAFIRLVLTCHPISSEFVCFFFVSRLPRQGTG